MRHGGWLAMVLVAATAAAQPDRPQLDDAQASRHRVEDYLDQGPSPWRPLPLAGAAGWAADLVVAADGSGTHRTLQAAIDALPAAGSTQRRHVIRLQPGLYRESVCARGKTPFSLVGDAADASAVRIVHGRWNAERQGDGVAANACAASTQATVGTAGSASVAIFSDDVQLAHLTIANDAMDGVRDGQFYPPGAGEAGGAQAVALMTQGDRIQLEDVRLVGHQDTFYVRGAGTRVYVHRSVIAGDVDFIFGDATLVIHRSTIHSRGGRRAPGEAGHVLAPSTAAARRLGFLVADSRFVAEPGLRAGQVSIGRAWDAGVARGQWQPGVSPNGQALVRDSVVGGHIGGWAASTARRPFSATGEAANRLFEHRNTLLTHEPGREVLPIDGGWAAAAGGTTGGAGAAAQDVLDVRTRRELAAALAGAPRPRIVRVHGTIDLRADDQGRPLVADDFRDPAFEWPAFLRQYDPAIWGRRPPAGPQEEARRRSAQRQSAHVLLRVPSNTTLVGAGQGARLTGGGLLLERVDNVIVRHLHFSDAYDFFPAWDPRDNAGGEWNSDYDNVSLRRATHVWVDHCSFDDGDRPDDREPLWLGRPVQRHDGLLDITRQSDWVTVSWSVFRQHDKTTLVGAGDGQHDDEGRLRVSFHHNLYEQVKERTPRVRYGRVHVYNNLFVGRADGPYAFGYSIGVGLQSRIVSEHNVWQLGAGVPPSSLVRLLRGQRFVDRGSLRDGAPADLAAMLGPSIDADVGWQPTLVHERDPAGRVADRVRAGAGAPRESAAANR